MLSKFETILKTWLESRTTWRSNVRAFSIGFIDSGLKDRAITRDIEWGVSVPEVGYENKRFYVWFEALLGYISNAQEFSISKGKNNLWLDYYSKGDSFYFMGKDNIFFHSIMLPAILEGYGHRLKLPTRVIGNEYLRFAGKKFSKSKGIGYNVNEILQLVDKDSLRYYISSILPESSDSDFSLHEMIGKVNGELADKYGNYANRILSFCIKKEISPEDDGIRDEEDTNAMNRVEESFKLYRENMDSLEFRKALSEWLNMVSYSNAYFNKSEPWKLIGTDRKACSRKLYLSLRLLDYCTLMLNPFVPSGTARIWTLYQNTHLKGTVDELIREDKKYQVTNAEIPFKKLETHEEPKNGLNLIVGKVMEVSNHPNADSLLLLKVSLGNKEVRLVAGLKKYYDPEKLLNRKIIVVENLKWAKIRGEESQGMLLAAQDSSGAHILTTDQEVGTKVVIGNYEYSGDQKVELEELRVYDLRVDVRDQTIEVTGIIGRDRQKLKVNGLPLTVDGEVQDRSHVR
ncbi:methionyl-tRNA synthetase [mine drainage metagenome]|uniref:methionine--tRNA ligase n=1 Tax=mine drainage metagenome TaxID=410659 RepID=T1BRI2_9ZZZZ